jgi:hypothetical protein
MSTKRQPSKQRRQTLNQRQRAALEARRANAAAGAVPDSEIGGSSGSAASSAGTTTAGGGSMLSRLRGATATGRAVRTGQPAGTTPVGHRAALSALLAAVAAAVVAALMITVPVDRSGEPISTSGALVGEWALSAWDVVQDDPSATPEEVVSGVDEWLSGGEERYGQAYFPQSLFLVLPVIGAALVFRAVARRAPGKTVNRAMYVTVFGALLNGGALLLFLPSAIGAGIAAFQVRKYEMTLARAAADDESAAGGSDTDGVIDVDEVDDDDLDDEELDAEELEEAIDDESAVETDELLEAEAPEGADADDRDR